MGSSEHGDGQVLPFSISAFWVSGAPGFDQRLHPPQIRWTSDPARFRSADKLRSFRVDMTGRPPSGHEMLPGGRQVLSPSSILQPRARSESGAGRRGPPSVVPTTNPRFRFTPWPSPVSLRTPTKKVEYETDPRQGGRRRPRCPSRHRSQERRLDPRRNSEYDFNLSSEEAAAPSDPKPCGQSFRRQVHPDRQITRCCL